MSKHPQPPQLAAVQKRERRARVLVIYEDTAPDAPRTWAVGLGTVRVSDVEMLELTPENNAAATKHVGMRHIDELDLLGSVSPWPA